MTLVVLLAILMVSAVCLMSSHADLMFAVTGFLADVLVRDALRLSPKLLLQMQANTHSLSAESITYHETGPFPAVTDHSLNITVIFDPETFLPYLIRSYEDHLIFGNSTNDYVLTNYTETSGMMFPRLVQIMYNENSLLLHSLRDTITINATFTDGFFSGLPLSLINETYSLLPPSAPVSSTEYGAAEVFENKSVASENIFAGMLISRLAVRI